MPTPLPDLPPIEVDTNAQIAYDVCLGYQTVAHDQGLMHARLLGYLIIHAPSTTARDEIVKLIDSCQEQEASLSELANVFIDYFIRPCKQQLCIAPKADHRPVKSAKGRTPASSDHSSRASLKDKTDELNNDREPQLSHCAIKQEASFWRPH